MPIWPIKWADKIGKKRMSVFGLRPKHTSILLTVLGGTIIAVLTISVMAIASQSARTALFGMEKIQQELKLLNQEKADTTAALEQAKGKVNEQNKKISELDAKIQEAVAEMMQWKSSWPRLMTCTARHRMR